MSAPKQEAAPPDAAAPPTAPAPKPAGAVPPPPPIGAIQPPPPAGLARAGSAVPPLAQPAPPMPATPDRSFERSTAEFLFELDSPTRPVSREIDLSASPELAAAIEQASAREPAAEPESEYEPDSEQGGALDLGAASISTPPLTGEIPVPPPRVSAAIPRPRSAEEEHEHRRRRTIVRVQTTRDAFRLLGYLGIPDEDRKAVARMLMGLEQTAAASSGQAGLVKEPERALRGATGEQLDTIERSISPIEDKLLALDDTVSVETFRDRAEGGKHSRKVLARYGRLLASRRFPAGQRRDRFEWIATHLLTSPSADGRRLPLPPDRARPVLQQLVGGLARKSKDEELQDGLRYLQEARERLQQIGTHEEFFEGGLLLDVHGHNVSMRDQLSSPDFLYLCATVNAEMWNRLEGWIRSLEQSHDANRLTAEGPPREQIMRRVREQEAAVDKIFGVKRRGSTAVGRAEPKPVTPMERKRRPAAKRADPLLEVDPRIKKFIALLIVLIGIGTTLAFQTGLAGKETVQFLERPQLDALSPVLSTAMIVDQNSQRTLIGGLKQVLWQPMDPRKKHDAADAIARGLARQNVKSARITLRGQVVIQIEQGLVTTVEGGKL